MRERNVSRGHGMHVRRLGVSVTDAGCLQSPSEMASLQTDRAAPVELKQETPPPVSTAY
ncbi:hypothetical protein ANANG_G00270320 [Anguilla anguilla]|uniref:Uncharacterized protein n=1 Tax=Anguilla anguilla TaxID=7936 RepID=A0A9D3RM31_ANGAN|nr:hypothetical protein ANANG_G00270320 [Anguilla anguilla]